MNRAAGPAILCLVAAATLAPAAEPPAPFGPLPSERHLRWHEMEYYGFIHFTVNTFTDVRCGPRTRQARHGLERPG